VAQGERLRIQLDQEKTMPQSNDARIKQINNHPEQAAKKADASHDQKPHLTPQESERKSEEHAQHKSSGTPANPADKK
jgi:hypothetical protein